VLEEQRGSGAPDAAIADETTDAPNMVNNPFLNIIILFDNGMDALLFKGLHRKQHFLKYKSADC
jgi:hypothetical protein